eukprot:UN11970
MFLYKVLQFPNSIFLPFRPEQDLKDCPSFPLYLHSCWQVFYQIHPLDSCLKFLSMTFSLFTRWNFLSAIVGSSFFKSNLTTFFSFSVTFFSQQVFR